jgi:hypothetical protein
VYYSSFLLQQCLGFHVGCDFLFLAGNLNY